MKLIFSFLTLFFSGVTYSASCPDGMAIVPANPPHNEQSYCVMTNEATRLTGSGSWNFISHLKASSVCKNAFYEGNLPVNSLWQSMARQAEMVNSNWTGAYIGVGDLKSDLLIPNGEGGYNMFYDLGGGHWEFVNGQFPGDAVINAGDIQDVRFSNQIIFLNGINRHINFHFGPNNYYPDSNVGTATDTYTQWIMRGGDDSEPGVFGTALNHQGHPASDASFRCACPLAACSIN